MTLELENSTTEVSSPLDVEVRFTIDELRALSQEFHSANFENRGELVCQTVRHLEERKREVQIMMKMLYAIELYEERAIKGLSEMSDG